MKTFPFYVLLVFGLLFTGCGGCGGGDKSSADVDSQSDRTEREKDQDKKSDQNSDNPFADLKKSVEGLTGNDADVEPVNFRDIQEKLFKEEVGKFKLEDKSGKTSGALGFNFTETEATYINDDGKEVTVRVVDVGGFGAGIMSMASWSMVNIDEEDKNGWKRSTEFLGYKAFEEFNKRTEISKISLIVDNRFIYEAEAKCPMQDLKGFIERMGPKKLGVLI